MVIRVVNIFFIVGIMAAMSCASGTASKSGGKSGQYYEDLSAYRPDYSAAMDTFATTALSGEEEINASLTPEYDVTDEVNMLMDSITYLKKDIRYVDGLTVQVYTGLNREQANEAKSKVYQILPDSRPVITYDQPNFKVKVGKFYTRREAERTFATLKKEFSAAIIIPERIQVENE